MATRLGTRTDIAHLLAGKMLNLNISGYDVTEIKTVGAERRIRRYCHYLILPRPRPTNRWTAIECRDESRLGINDPLI